MRLRIAHVITGLGGGGAEHMLERLVGALAAPDFSHTVISLTDEGALGRRLRAAGCEVRVLGFRKSPGALLACARLVSALRGAAPDVIQTWLAHADLLGGLAGRYVLEVPVVWGVHQAETESVTTPWTTRLVQWLCARASRAVPSRVVSVSQAGSALLAARGYPAARLLVIPNGVDTAVFRPDLAARTAIRAQLDLGDDQLAVVLVARWHPDKDHGNFLAAAAIVQQACPDARFLLVGAGMTADNTTLVERVTGEGLTARCALLGERDDVPRLLAACDLAVLSSRTEALPNVLLEAMASGLPVVATDVGDVAHVLGDAGRVVPRADPAALAGALQALLELPHAQRVALGARGRERVLHDYSLARAAARYAELYTALARAG